MKQKKDYKETKQEEQLMENENLSQEQTRVRGRFSMTGTGIYEGMTLEEMFEKNPKGILTINGKDFHPIR